MSVTNQIKVAILEKLKEQFPEYRRYSEEIKQGFQAPCFFLATINNQSEQKTIGKRYMRTISFDLHFFPPKGEGRSNERMYEIGDLLYMLLEVAQIPEQLVYGSDMHFEIVDGVLHFFVDYKVFVYRQTEPDAYMEKLNVERAVLKKWEMNKQRQQNNRKQCLRRNRL